MCCFLVLYFFFLCLKGGGSKKHPRPSLKDLLRHEAPSYDFKYINNKRIRHYYAKYHQKKWKLDWLSFLLSLLNWVLNSVILAGIVLIPTVIVSNYNFTSGTVYTTNNYTQLTTITNTVNTVINQTNTVRTRVNVTSLKNIVAQLETSNSAQITNIQNTPNGVQNMLVNIEDDVINLEIFLTGLPGLLNGVANQDKLVELLNIITAILTARSGPFFNTNHGMDISGLVALGGNAEGQVEYIEIDLENDAIIINDPHDSRINMAMLDYYTKNTKLGKDGKSLLRSESTSSGVINEFLGETSKDYDACLSSFSHSLLKVLFCEISCYYHRGRGPRG